MWRKYDGHDYEVCDKDNRIKEIYMYNAMKGNIIMCSTLVRGNGTSTSNKFMRKTFYFSKPFPIKYIFVHYL